MEKINLEIEVALIKNEQIHIKEKLTEISDSINSINGSIKEMKLWQALLTDREKYKESLISILKTNWWRILLIFIAISGIVGETIIHFKENNHGSIVRTK